MCTRFEEDCKNMIDLLDKLNDHGTHVMFHGTIVCKKNKYNIEFYMIMCEIQLKNT